MLYNKYDVLKRMENLWYPIELIHPCMAMIVWSR